jgi:hypothetical protein
VSKCFFINSATCKPSFSKSGNSARYWTRSNVQQVPKTIPVSNNNQREGGKEGGVSVGTSGEKGYCWWKTSSKGSTENRIGHQDGVGSWCARGNATKSIAGNQTISTFETGVLLHCLLQLFRNKTRTTYLLCGGDATF